MRRARRAEGIRSFASATSMATRLAAAALIVGLVSLLIAMVVGISSGRELGKDLYEDRLMAARESGAIDVANYMQSLARTSDALASSPQAAASIEQLTGAHAELLSIPGSDLADEAEALVDDYRTAYVEPLAAAGRDVDLRDVATTNPAAIYLQFHYVVDVDEADDPAAVDDAGDGSSWSELHRSVHPVYRDVVDRRGLVDLLLVEPEHGYVVYSVRKRPDLGTSLDLGPVSGSVVSGVVDRVRDDPSAGSGMGDLSFYDPAVNTPVGVIASPVTDGDGLVGVVVLVYDSAPLDDLLTAGGDWDGGGFPPSGETFLVGADGRVRSSPRGYLEEPVSFLDAAESSGQLDESERMQIEASGTAVLSQRAVDATVDAAVDGDRSVDRRDTFVGDEAFSTTTAVDLEGLEWYVVSEVEASAARGDLEDFQELLVVGTAVFVVTLAFAAVGWAGRIVHPIRSISDRLAEQGRDRRPIEVSPRSPIEFQRLAASFESMSVAMVEHQLRLVAAREERLELLRSMLPPAVAERVEAGDIRSLEEVPQASVVVLVVLGLADLVHVDNDGSDVDLIDRLHAELDDLATRHGVERITVVGDAYFAACGHDRPYIDHAPRAVAFAADAQDAIRDIGASTPSGLDASIGIHTGPVTVGMTGGERLVYDVWGVTVSAAHNLARRAQRGEILISGDTRAMLPETIDVAPALEEDEHAWSVSTVSVGGPA